MNSLGTLYKISLFGESHGERIGVVIDGCPPGIPLCIEDFIPDVLRRKSGAKGTTPRKEEDSPEIVSGLFNGFTTGTPLTILFKNENTISDDYNNLIHTPRPGHADFVSRIKYKGFADYRGGGHFSGRVTLALIAAGVIAKKICKDLTISASVTQAGGNNNIEEAIDKAIENHDSIGGIVECRVKGLPVGLGEPFFNSVESLISHMAFSIPAIKGIEFGSGFQAASMTGSQHNDAIIDSKGTTQKNDSGGINGGITNSNEMFFRVAVKPTSSISKIQHTLNFETNTISELEVKGRHDVCIALRVPVVLEAITAIVFADLLLIEKSYN